MSLRKLFLWIFICILTLCALRYGVLESANQYIYNLRNTHIPSFAYRYDDFLPYLPLTVMFGLKIAGIKSRSNWIQMLVATVFSFALMVITVSSIKSLAGVLRPDGSDLLSFPSGHTATAFTSACLLYKEYGKKNILVSIVAYLPAVVTGITRQLNNRHWLSDVVGGAVIGIVAVEVGYFFTDLLFKKKQN
ncbi:phosphatase PAP2 family protein [Bacteroides sp.]|uniref:phosphatase PAP2 family protein n=1 Tax=Bacteroides sp. TaxID=29523 RepID=UPI00345DC794